MKEQFVPYEQALKLKELGFDEECLAGYIRLKGSNSWELAFYKDRIINFNKTSNLYVSAPLWQQTFDWFRDVMLLDNFIIPYWFIDGEYKVKKYTYSIEPSNRFDEYFDCDSDQYDTYEEARLECLKRLIELCEM